MFPNYSDAIPPKLNQYVAELMKAKDVQIVPGHGPMAGQTDVAVYKQFLEFVQASAEKGFKSGKSAENAAKDFQLPEKLKDWLVWSPDVVKRSYVAWYKQFEPADSTSK